MGTLPTSDEVQQRIDGTAGPSTSSDPMKNITPHRSDDTSPESTSTNGGATRSTEIGEETREESSTRTVNKSYPGTPGNHDLHVGSQGPYEKTGTEVPVHIGTFRNGGQDGWDDNGNPTTMSALSRDTGIPVEVLAEQMGIENIDVIPAETDYVITFDVESVEGYKHDVEGIRRELREILHEVEQVLSLLCSENDVVFTEGLASKLSDITTSLTSEFNTLSEDADSYIAWLDKSIETMREAMAKAEAEASND